jgi:aminoglycoside/choline kinase family phosphotransferase
MKTDLLLRQTRMHFPRFDADEVDISPIEKGGSDRKFYRVRCSAEQSLILVKYNLEREENRHYVEIARFLEASGIRAPKIYFHDPDEGLIWIEDLGERDLFSYRDESWLVRRAFYESALDEVSKLHGLPEKKVDSIRANLPAEFNTALYLWEQHYFLENCLGRYFQVDESKLKQLGTLPALCDIARQLDARPRILVHRDFQSQNIIIQSGHAYLIDFQGMRPGLAQYDLASLLYDPYVELSEAERTELVEYYREQQRRNEAEHDPAFDLVLRFCAMQRLMQALGAYGFLGLVREHKVFLSHIPGALKSLCVIVEEIPGLDALRSILADLPGS